MSQLFDPDAAHDWLREQWGESSSVPWIITGLGHDDCAVLQIDGVQVVTTDYLNANPIILEMGIGGNYELGRLLVASNLSDLCGSGAEPLALLLGITMEREATFREFATIMEGAAFEASRWGVTIVGGDSKLGASRALLATAIGRASAREELFTMDGACPEDELWVSGDIGSCAAAIVCLQDGSPNLPLEWARRVLMVPDLPLSEFALGGVKSDWARGDRH